MMKVAKIGLILTIAVIISSCASKQRILVKNEVCSVPSFLTNLPDYPVKPSKENGYPTNAEIDYFFKYKVETEYVCELSCIISDIIYICTGTQQEIHNVPAHCNKYKC